MCPQVSACRLWFQGQTSTGAVLEAKFCWGKGEGDGGLESGAVQGQWKTCAREPGLAGMSAGAPVYSYWQRVWGHRDLPGTEFCCENIVLEATAKSSSHLISFLHLEGVSKLCCLGLGESCHWYHAEVLPAILHSSVLVSLPHPGSVISLTISLLFGRYLRVWVGAQIHKGPTWLSLTLTSC